MEMMLPQKQSFIISKTPKSYVKRDFNKPIRVKNRKEFLSLLSNKYINDKYK